MNDGSDLQTGVLRGVEGKAACMGLHQASMMYFEINLDYAEKQSRSNYTAQPRHIYLDHSRRHMGPDLQPAKILPRYCRCLKIREAYTSQKCPGEDSLADPTSHAACDAQLR